MRLGRSLIPFEVKVSWTKDQQPSQLEHSLIIEGAKNYGLTVTTPVAFGKCSHENYNYVINLIATKILIAECGRVDSRTINVQPQGNWYKL